MIQDLKEIEKIVLSRLSYARGTYAEHYKRNDNLVEHFFGYMMAMEDLAERLEMEEEEEEELL